MRQTPRQANAYAGDACESATPRCGTQGLDLNGRSTQRRPPLQAETVQLVLLLPSEPLLHVDTLQRIRHTRSRAGPRAMVQDQQFPTLPFLQTSLFGPLSAVEVLLHVRLRS